jgi:propionyl-CoA synthetase
MMRSIADGEEFQIPSTIDDEASIEEIREVLQTAKIGSFK